MWRATATRSLGRVTSHACLSWSWEASGGADAGGVEAYAELADPAHAGGGVGEQGDGGVRDPAAGSDQEDGEVGGGDVDHAGLVDDDDGVVVAVDVAAFGVEAGDAVLKAVDVLGAGSPPGLRHGVPPW